MRYVKIQHNVLFFCILITFQQSGVLLLSIFTREAVMRVEYVHQKLFANYFEFMMMYCSLCLTLYI